MAAGLMEQRVSCISLGVDDIERARTFYEAMGWQKSPASREIMPLFNANGMVFILFSRAGLAKEAFGGTNLPDVTRPGFSGVALTYVVRAEEEVAQILERAEANGARITAPAARHPWGNTSGYFQDPDGYIWEISKTQRTPLQPDGRFTIGE